MARCEFQTIDDLAAWLAAVGIDTNGWGQAESKRLADLWAEYKSGEAVIEDDPPARLLNVAEIAIRRGGLLLLEIKQEFADGRHRARLVPPSEKLKPDESPRAAALRCLREELGLDEAHVRIGKIEQTIEHAADSPSYPGLLTRYVFHTFAATADTLPDEDFYHVNTAPDDPIRRHLWGWRQEKEPQISQIEEMNSG